MATLHLESTGLEGARAALAPPARPSRHMAVALLCACLMAVCGIAVSVLVLLSGSRPVARAGPVASVRAAISR